MQEIRKGNHQQNAEKTDRTFTYIYTHPDIYEPLAQCYKERENAQHTVNYFHCDQIGVPREMTDSQGKLIWKGRYDAWGQLIHDSNRYAQRTTHQPFRLQNQYFDQETGLHYNFLRYYEPALGRFTQQDPIGLMGGMNLYQFAANTQTMSDPKGLSPNFIYSAEQWKGLEQAAKAQQCKIYDNTQVKTVTNTPYTIATQVSGSAAAGGAIDFSGGLATTRDSNGKLSKCGFVTMCGGVGVGGGAQVSMQTSYSNSATTTGITYPTCTEATATLGGGVVGSVCTNSSSLPGGDDSITTSVGTALGAKTGGSLKQCVQITYCH